MNNSKVRRFPVNDVKRRRNRLGKRGVRCAVTDRWLEFPEESTPLRDGHFMFVNVMTTADGESIRKLCTLCISKEDVSAALNLVK